MLFLEVECFWVLLVDTLDRLVIFDCDKLKATLRIIYDGPLLISLLGDCLSFLLEAG